MNELISVIIPTYNRGDILFKAIKSVQNQTYVNLEILVVDDYGTDSLEGRIEKITSEDIRVRYIRNERSKGVSGARNTGILKSSGTYISFLDSDDEWAPRHLEQMIESLKESKTDVGFSLWYEGAPGKMKAIAENEAFKKLLNRAERELDVEKKESYYIFGRDFFQFTILTYFYCYHLNTMVINRNTLLEAGLFDETLASSEDCKLLFSIISKNKFILYMDYHYYYYYWSDSTYAFLDREKIDVGKLVTDCSVVKKLTGQGLDKIKVRKFSSVLVKNSPYCVKKRECRKVIREAIYNKYMTLGIINQCTEITKAVKYLMKAFLVKLSFAPLVNIVRVYRQKITKNQLPVALDRSMYDFF